MTAKDTALATPGWHDCGNCGEAWEDHKDRPGFGCPEKSGSFYSSCAPAPAGETAPEREE